MNIDMYIDVDININIDIDIHIRINTNISIHTCYENVVPSPGALVKCFNMFPLPICAESSYLL